MSSSQLKLARCPRSLAATLAALPSMSRIPIRSIVSRLLQQRLTATSRLYRPCRSSRSLHSARLRARYASW